MNIRKAKYEDLETIEKIYADARDFMKASGNPEQWKNTYPCHDLLVKDIDDACLYICEENEEMLGAFFFKIGEDATYKKIYDGEWKNKLPYAVIHRIAVAKNAHGKGVARACFDYGFGISGNLKIDTHKDNLPMQKALFKYGFERCGIIYLENGEERIAFQKYT